MNGTGSPAAHADRADLTRSLALAAGLLGLLLGFVWLFRPPAVPQDGRVHIRYWEKWTGFEEDAMRKVVDLFNARQDRIFVEMLAVSQVDQKMLLSTAGGNPPDVAGVWDANVPVYADYNAIQNLDERSARDGITASGYLPAYWELCRHRGHTFSLPTTPASVALHWNRDHFREAGLDPDRAPRTLEELDSYSDRLTKRVDGKILRTGFLPAEPGWWNWGWGYWFGGRLWNGSDRITMTAPENVRAFKWVKGYADRYGAKDLQVFQSGFGNFSSPQNAFMAGKVAMVMQGVWMANFIHNNNPGMDWDAAPFPYPADRPELARSTPVGLDVLAIPTGAKHPEEAWEFIKFVQSQEGMELLCAGQWKHSPLARVSDRFYREHRNKRIRLFWELAAGKNTFAPPSVGIWREWQDELKAGFENIWTNGQEPEQALTYVQARTQPKLDRYLEGLARRGDGGASDQPK
jgi:ABC-type glycerol-3-phosphate transport system substrate-binding protein